MLEYEARSSDLKRSEQEFQIQWDIFAGLYGKVSKKGLRYTLSIAPRALHLEHCTSSIAPQYTTSSIINNVISTIVKRWPYITDYAHYNKHDYDNIYDIHISGLVIA